MHCRHMALMALRMDLPSTLRSTGLTTGRRTADSSMTMDSDMKLAPHSTDPTHYAEKSLERKAHRPENTAIMQNVCIDEHSRGELKMALTKDFRETVRERARSDADFREALQAEADAASAAGETELSRQVMADLEDETPSHGA